MKKDIAEELTQRFIEQLEAGVIPWRKPWAGGFSGAISHSTGKPYGFVNQILLEPGEYITFAQAIKEGGHVNKGAKSKDVYMWIHKAYEVKDEDGNTITDEDGNPELTHRYALTSCKVFNVNDCTGIKNRVEPEPVANNDTQPIEKAEEIIKEYIAKSGINFETGFNSSAYYCSSSDLVSIPQIEQYEAPEEFYSTAFHELTHSTGHKSRLSRDVGTAAFGSKTYSKEELIAEIGAAALVNYCGIETDKSFQNSAAYIESWLKVLKSDKNILMTAATKAQKAVDYILN